jgi:hypothetical protein
MGRDKAYWHRRGRGGLLGEGRVSFRDILVERRRQGVRYRESACEYWLKADP